MTQNLTDNLFAFGYVLRLDPQRELTALHRPLGWIKGARFTTGKGGQERDKRGKRDEGSSPYHKFLDPPLPLDGMLQDYR